LGEAARQKIMKNETGVVGWLKKKKQKGQKIGLVRKQLPAGARAARFVVLSQMPHWHWHSIIKQSNRILLMMAWQTS